MEKEIRTLSMRYYPKSVFKFLAFYMGAISIVSLSVWGYDIYKQNVIVSDSCVISIIALGMTIWCLSRVWYADRLYKVFLDHLLILNRKNVNKINYDQVFRVEFAKAGKNVCLVLVLKDQKKVRIPHCLERPEYILEAMIKFNPKLILPGAYDKLRELLIQNDHANARLGIAYVIPFLIGVSIIILAAAELFYQRQEKLFIIYSFRQYLSHFFSIYFYPALFVFIAVELWVQRKFKKILTEQLRVDPTNKIRNLHNEKKSRVSTLVVQYSGISMLILISCFFDLNMFGVIRVKEDTAWMGIRKNGRHVYDMRYNCVGCAHSLKKGDGILLKNRSVVKIEAIPGETVALRGAETTGRFLASDTVQVPVGSLAVASKGGAVIQLVEQREIVGKFISLF